MDKLLETVEAIVFASGTGIKMDELLNGLPDDVSRKDLKIVVSELEKKYSKENNSGILFLNYNNKLQFSTNPDYGVITSEILQKQKEKELTKILLEVLAIVAYKQPVTRLEIEDIRGNSSEYAIGVLTSTNLIEVVGRKDTIGRPSLYGTTDEFLKKFELNTLEDLPGLDEINKKLAEIYDTSYVGSDLYKNVEVNNDDDGDDLTPQEIREKRERDSILKQEEIGQFDARLKSIADYLEQTKIPEFLEGEEYEFVTGDDDE